MAGQGKQTSAERRRERAAAARAETLAARRKQRLKALGILVALVLLAGAGTGAWFGARALFGGDDDVVAESPPEPSLPSAPAGKANCEYLEAGSATKDVGRPPAVADASGTYYATLQVNKGTVVMELDAAAAPCAVNSFVHLAKAGYFDATICHRQLDNEADETLGTLETHVIQCGDPSEKPAGTGNPGYRFAEENLDGATYEKGVVAMAKSPAPASSGSQFFMMFGDSGFPPEYTPFAKIISGIEVLTEIAKGGTTGPNNDVPKTKITIAKVTISETKPASTSKPKK